MSEQANIKRLGDVIASGSYGVLPPGDSYLESGGVRFLRPTEMRPNNEVVWNSCLRAPLEFSKKTRARLKNGDVLIAVKGATIASEKSVCVIRDLSEPTIVNGSIFHFQPIEDVSSEYLLNVLSSDFAKKQMKQGLILNNAVDYLSRTIIDDFLIPIPTLETQRALVTKMEVARTARQQKLDEAETLLAGIDDFVLEQLGLEMPVGETELSFAITQADLAKRLDTYFYKPHLREAENRVLSFKPETKKLSQLLASPPQNGVDARKYLSSGQKYLRVQNIRPFDIILDNAAYVESENKKDIALREGDVLLTRKGTFGTAALVTEESTNCLISSEIILLRLSENSNCSPEYLVAWLNSRIGQMLFDRYKSGAIMGHITQNVVKNFPIPIASTQIQEKIADEIQSRRSKALQLRKEAETLWQEAKGAFEKALLGE